MGLAQLMVSFAYAALCRQTLPILIYHQVVAEPDPLRPGVPDRREFEWQMELLRTQFTPLPLRQAVSCLQMGELPPSAVCVTFDDGYRDNLEVALPVLQSFDIPATVFVATHYLGGENMWNDRVIDLVGVLPGPLADFSLLGLGLMPVGSIEQKRQTYEKLLEVLKYMHYDDRLVKISALYQQFDIAEAPPKMMTPDQVRTLAQAGIEIGAHTVHHPILRVLDPREQYQQIKSSKEQLEAITDQSVVGFAYPNGKPGKDYDEVAVDHLHTLGFEYAVSTSWGSNGRSESVFELKRFTPWEKQPLRFQQRLLWNGLKTATGQYRVGDNPRWRGKRYG